MAADIGAFQTKYRNELILGFEDRQSRLRSTVVTEAEVNGNQAVFLVSDSGGATATTRGADGLLVARDDSHTQNTITMVEWHDLVRKSRFNIFARPEIEAAKLNFNIGFRLPKGSIHQAYSPASGD